MTAVTNFSNGLAIDDFTIPHHATITVGAEATNVVTCNIQLYADTDALQELDSNAMVFVYLSDNADGNGVAATAPSGGIASGTDGFFVETFADEAGYAYSEADGDIDLTVTETGADTFYLVVILPTGRIIVSDALTFTA